MRSKFIKNNDTIGIGHEWGTSCNLKCSFCYNEGNTDINNKIVKEHNFKIVDEMVNLKGDILYYETGGELLTCNYLDELIEYKINNIKNYKGLFFTNGTYSTRYYNFITKYKDYLEPVLSLHINFITEQNLKEFLKSYNFTLELFDNVNVNIVYHKGLEINNITNVLTKLDKEKTDLKILLDVNIFSDRKLLMLEMVKVKKLFTYLDINNYNARNCINDTNVHTFMDKFNLLFKKEEMENVFILPEVDFNATVNGVNIEANGDFLKTNELESAIKEINTLDFSKGVLEISNVSDDRKLEMTQDL